MKIIAVSGVDGSGKSTFGRELREMLASAGHDRVTAAWLRYNPRATVRRSGDQAQNSAVSTLDRRHRGHIAKRVARELGAASPWRRASVALYNRQLRLQIGSFQDCDVLIADRFVLDFLADQIGGGVMRLKHVAATHERLPKADITFVLTASDETLAERRDPNESLEGLVARRDLYLHLATALGHSVLDTTDPDWRATTLAILAGRHV